MPSSLLAFDLGAESGRATAGQLDGRHLTLTGTHRFADMPVRLPGGLHWNILGLWDEILKGMAAMSEQISREVASIGLDTWGVDFALLDAQDQRIGNPFHYRDSRTDGMMERAVERVPPSENFRQTGIQVMQINSLYQLLSLHDAASPALESAGTLLMIPDLLNFWLCVAKRCEFSNATTTQCHDPQRREWARPLLDKPDIPGDTFPEVVYPGNIVGESSSYVSGVTGVGPGPVISPACHDTGSAVAAGGMTLLDAFQWLETLDFCACTLIRASSLGPITTCLMPPQGM